MFAFQINGSLPESNVNKIVLFSNKDDAIKYFYSFLGVAFKNIMEEFGDEEYPDNNLDFAEVQSILLAKGEEHLCSPYFECDVNGKGLPFMQLYCHHSTLDLILKLEELVVYDSYIKALELDGLDIPEN